ncbi:MAG: hypothetical protein MUO58_19465 [Anaerolineales bacterium]|nr:hypothetical protein [Anaerolineales bacterium]
MAQNKILKMALHVLVFLGMLSIAGCEEYGRRAFQLIQGTYEVPTPYITPVAHGTSHLLITPFPHGTPVFNKDRCFILGGDTYLVELHIQYRLFEVLRGTTGEKDREDLPPIIDEMSEIHGKIRALEPPSDCEILDVLRYHIEAEIDQTIRALVVFRNLEPEETMMDYFNEALFHKTVIQELFTRVSQ